MPKVYIVNTNKVNNGNIDEQDMLENEKCSAYYSPWKYKIDAIAANDMVFLYSNENGIIARGLATGIVELADYQGHEDEEHYMHLNRFELLNTPVPSSIINEMTELTVVLNRTVIEIPYDNGLRLWQYMTKKGLHKKVVEEVKATSKPSLKTESEELANKYAGW
ncbi:hypothetical protein U8V72_21455 [Priestia filamentosa]|uniref:hypothetical protein n=1 Tax=Priestia filamentosa TaxID=1402861 RepID=UPI00397E140F